MMTFRASGEGGDGEQKRGNISLSGPPVSAILNLGAGLKYVTISYQKEERAATFPKKKKCL